MQTSVQICDRPETHQAGFFYFSEDPFPADVSQPRLPPPNTPPTGAFTSWISALAGWRSKTEVRASADKPGDCSFSLSPSVAARRLGVRAHQGSSQPEKQETFLRVKKSRQAFCARLRSPPPSLSHIQLPLFCFLTWRQKCADLCSERARAGNKAA